MTLRLLILRKLADGRPATAASMGRLWGEDARRCGDWLEKFARIGVVRALPARTDRGPRRDGRTRGVVYRPLKRAVFAELARDR